MANSPLAVGGNRLRWPDLPAHVQQTIEDALGAAVVGAENREGGFSPALASVLTLADGRRVFAKAVDAERSEFSVDALRREAKILAALPPSLPASKLIWFGEYASWTILILEAVDGHTPAQPWQPAELARFLDAATLLADSLTPTPIDLVPLGDDVDAFTNWEKLPDHPHAAELAALEADWATAVAGNSLLHGDLRADNFLLTADGFVVVDWPAACVGAPWVDLVLGLPSVAMHGGGDPEALWAAHPLSRRADPAAVDVVLAGIAGFFVARSLEPPVPLLPTIREFQRVQGEITLAWLACRRGWA
ncbi:MAG: phosphotransferase [Hamadaea sp.]|nr:phosphotransferase [Hamadaea sp.]